MGGCLWDSTGNLERVPRARQDRGSAPGWRLRCSPSLQIAGASKGAGPPLRGRAGFVFTSGHAPPHTGCFKAFVPKRLVCTAQQLKELDIYQFEISLAKKRGERH